jgi:hypothetical protein
MDQLIRSIPWIPLVLMSFGLFSPAHSEPVTQCVPSDDLRRVLRLRAIAVLHIASAGTIVESN